jgi:hypothetical protein
MFEVIDWSEDQATLPEERGWSSLELRLATLTHPSVWCRLIELWGIKMRAFILSFREAVLLVIAGMIWGILMGISQDRSTMPAHAHLNLLGWVSLFLFGIYYHLHPAVDRSRLASLQIWVWIAGT